MRSIAAAIALTLFGLALPGCQSPGGPAERTGRTLDRAGERTGETLERGAEATGRTIKKGVTKTGETLEKVGD
jgi:hypothetical protein